MPAHDCLQYAACLYWRPTQRAAASPAVSAAACTRLANETLHFSTAAQPRGPDLACLQTSAVLLLRFVSFTLVNCNLSFHIFTLSLRFRSACMRYFNLGSFGLELGKLCCGRLITQVKQ